MILTTCQSNREQCLPRPFAPLASGDVGIQEGQLDVLFGAGARKQVELLKDEPDLPASDLCKFVALELADADAIERVATRRGDVEAPQNVHQRGLA